MCVEMGYSILMEDEYNVIYIYIYTVYIFSVYNMILT